MSHCGKFDRHVSWMIPSIIKGSGTEPWSLGWPLYPMNWYASKFRSSGLQRPNIRLYQTTTLAQCLPIFNSASCEKFCIFVNSPCKSKIYKFASKTSCANIGRPKFLMLRCDVRRRGGKVVLCVAKTFGTPVVVCRRQYAWDRLIGGVSRNEAANDSSPVAR